MNKLFFILWITILFSGCVKLQILPEDSVKNGISAAKNMYNESSLKRSGGVKKVYLREVVLNAYSSEQEAERACFANLMGRATSESPIREPIIISERAALRQNNQDTVLECQYEAYIWP